jgi:hypothetical protein
MPRTLKPALVEQIRPLVEQGLNGSQIAKAVAISDREARLYAQQIRAERTSANGSGPDPTPPGATIDEVPLAQIHVAGETQARERLDRQVIAEYAEAMMEGAIFPSVVLFFDGDEGFYIGDGFHRIQAAQEVGFTTIRAEVRRGGARAAQLYAASANQTHGLRRTNADKRRAVLILLQDDEWHQWSDREIARHCGVSPTFIGSLRSSLSTVDSEAGQRTYTTKHGTMTTMDTTRIGAREATPTPANGTPADDRETDPTPVPAPETDDDEDWDAEEDAYTIYLNAWERLSRAHTFWVRHVDGQLVDEVVTRAGAEVSSHIKELHAMADSLQFYAAGLQRACGHREPAA